jgi:hypothetical protein
MWYVYKPEKPVLQHKHASASKVSVLKSELPSTTKRHKKPRHIGFTYQLNALILQSLNLLEGKGIILV